MWGAAEGGQNEKLLLICHNVCTVYYIDRFRWFNYTSIRQMALQPNPAEHSRDYSLPHEHSRDFDRSVYKSVRVLTPLSSFIVETLSALQENEVAPRPSRSLGPWSDQQLRQNIARPVHTALPGLSNLAANWAMEVTATWRDDARTYYATSDDCLTTLPLLTLLLRLKKNRPGASFVCGMLKFHIEACYSTSTGFLLDKEPGGRVGNQGT